MDRPAHRSRPGLPPARLRPPARLYRAAPTAPGLGQRRQRSASPPLPPSSGGRQDPGAAGAGSASGSPDGARTPLGPGSRGVGGRGGRGPARKGRGSGPPRGWLGWPCRFPTWPGLGLGVLRA